MGHDINICKLAYPELAKMPDRKEKLPQASTKVYKKKDPKGLNVMKEIPEFLKDPEVNKVPQTNKVPIATTDIPSTSQQVVKDPSYAQHQEKNVQGSQLVDQANQEIQHEAQAEQEAVDA